MSKKARSLLLSKTVNRGGSPCEFCSGKLGEITAEVVKAGFQLREEGYAVTYRMLLDSISELAEQDDVKVLTGAENFGSHMRKHVPEWRTA